MSGDLLWAAADTGSSSDTILILSSPNRYQSDIHTFLRVDWSLGGSQGLVCVFRSSVELEN